MAEQVFVARERELARLGEMLTAAMAGETRVCFVTGEAGAGKSSLQEITRQVGHVHLGLSEFETARACEKSPSFSPI